MSNTLARDAAVFLAILVAVFMFGSSTHLKAQEPEDVPPPLGGIPAYCIQELTDETGAQCLGRALTDYMNTVIEGTEGLGNINVLSPAFNLTSDFEPPVYAAMVECGANFPALWGYSGNTYTLDGKAAIDYYIDNGWAAEFAGKPVVFTEFGDYGTQSIGTEDAGRGSLITGMTAEYNRALGYVGAGGINYFSALEPVNILSNPQFIGTHKLEESELLQITAANRGAAGLNPGLWIQGGRVQQEVDRLGIGWAVEILPGTNSGGVTGSVNNSDTNTVLRICVGNSCEFEDPDDLVDFLRSINSVINKPVWVIAGPNEPVSEPWIEGGSGCDLPIISEVGGGIVGIPPPASDPPPAPPPPPYANCQQTNSPEFHSLRPYPASSCINTVFTEVRMCANDFTAREVIQVNRDQASFCNPTADPLIELCTFNVDSTISIEIAPTQSRFPIMGNTELVPNSTNNGDNQLSFPQRVNEYVSWYLNGTTGRAEEEDETTSNNPYINDVQRAERTNEVINFSGPIKKLLPFNIQNGLYDSNLITIWRVYNGLRTDQVEDAQASLAGANIRHNQIVVCASFDAGTSEYMPLPCYTESNAYIRLVNGFADPLNAFRLGLNRIYSFIPFSSTEDLYGNVGFTNEYEVTTSMADVSVTPNWPSSGNFLSFPHIIESVQLANELQKTYTPIEYVSESDEVQVDGTVLYGNPPLDQYNEQRDSENCVIQETRRNPGDILYGVVNDGDPDRLQSPRQEGSVTYTAEFSCEFIIQVPEPACVALCSQEVANGNPDFPIGFECAAYCTAPPPLCQQYIDITMGIESSTPLAHSIWDKFVAGDYAIFRRMFPRVEPGAPVDEIEDIPAEDRLWYISRSISNSLGPGAILGNGPLAGDPSAIIPGANAALYFPHIGSVHQYFLQDIQKALRPFGIGSVVGPSITGEGDNFLCSIEGSGIQSQELLNMIANAASWANIPVEVLIATVRTEGCGGGDPRVDLAGGRSTELCQYSDDQVLQYSVEGARDPRNCNGPAYGPLQFLPSLWNVYSDAINIATGENRATDICNIRDAIYASAWTLSEGYARCPLTSFYDVANTPDPSTWTLDDMERTLSYWASGCNYGQCEHPFAEFYCAAVDIWGGQITTGCN